MMVAEPPTLRHTFPVTDELLRGMSLQLWTAVDYCRENTNKDKCSNCIIRICP